MILQAADITSVAQFVTVLLIFIFVLAITYYVTKWTANFQRGRLSGSNIEVLETQKIAPDKYIQIIRVADKYLAVALGKDSICVLREIPEDELVLSKNDAKAKGSFEETLKKVKEKKKQE